MADSEHVEDDWAVEDLPWDELQLRVGIEDELEEMEIEEEVINQTINRSSTVKNLTLKQKRLLVDNLLVIQNDGKLPWGFMTKVALQVGCHKSTVSRIYKDAMAQRNSGNAIDVTNKMYGKCGPKPKEYSDEFLQSCPLQNRTTIRSFAGALKLPHITVYRLLKKGRLRSHTSTNHPRVTEQHKVGRMKWVLSHLLPQTENRKPTFVSMQNVIHIDEKWFYLNPEMRRFYLLPFEDDPYRCCQSKRFRIKVMFIAVIGRPIYDSNGTLIHDGKYGIFPFVEYVAAKKSSKNRAAGTVETNALQLVTQQVMRRILIDKVIPAIMAKWPENLPKDIIIQQDNARPHISDDDIEFREAASRNGFNIRLVNQPPQSLDLNILDLCLFRSIQAIQNQSFPKTLDELVARVEEAYTGYDPHKIKFAWLQLQYVMAEILKVQGGNNYKNPHNGKAHLERIGMLPTNVEVDNEVVQNAIQFLNDRFITLSEDVNYLHEELEVDAD